MKISIITPCYNAEHYIRETMESILTQTAVLSGRVELEYIICDGGSKDGTVALAQKIGGDRVTIISERDRGMYDALAKGLKRATGDIVAYLNAGDYYHKCAFDIVTDLFETGKVSWLTGYTIIYNERSYVIHWQTPYRFRRRLFACGRYGNKLPFVQQESTFWSRELLQTLDYEYLAGLKYAGDYYLWKQFSDKADLKIVRAYLGGFRVHDGQISESIEPYRAEMRAMTRKPNWVDHILARCDGIIWVVLPIFGKMLNPNGIFKFDTKEGKWV